MRAHSLFPAVLAVLAVSAAAQQGGLPGCRAIADAAQRLACYDALPLPPAPAVAAVATPQKAVEGFGLERQQPAPVLAAVDRIDSTIPGRFQGWGGSSQFTLANGQVWRVTDGSSAYLDKENPRVQITRGMLGAFFMQVEGMNRTARVKRVE